MTRDITIGGVSLHSLTSKQLEDIIHECEEILVSRILAGNYQKNPLLKPGLKKEIQSTFQQDP